MREALHIRLAASSADWEIARQMLAEEHFLGAGREAGDRLCQFVMEDGKVVALLIWCAAAWHLKDRDQVIGWDPVTRSQRLKLVVRLRRFLVPETSRRPNLASRCLGPALPELPAQWLAGHDDRPLLAGSSSDPESHHGTACKATNRTFAGDTAGFSQDHADYHLPNDRPKKPWLKPLDPRAVQLMCSKDLPDDCQQAVVISGGARSPLKIKELTSLRSAFLQVPDPRRPRSRRHPLSAMLTLIAPDPLHNKQDTLRVIVAKGGDFPVGTKANTSKRLVGVEKALKDTPFLS